MALMFVSEISDLSKDLYLLASPFYHFSNMNTKTLKNILKNERVSPKLQLEFLNEFINACSNDYSK